MLPLQFRYLSKQWNFNPEVELPGGHCSRVFADATRVLKVPFQGEEMTSGWIAALRLAGEVGPQVFEHDPTTGALLMERITPGTSLAQSTLDEMACRQIVADFTRGVQTLDCNGLASVSTYVDATHPLVKRLLETTEQKVFLHGDLHHANILQGPSGWVVIDPKGLAGDPAFEPSAFIRNPLEWIGEVPELPRLLEDRIRWFASELGVDPWRVAGWSLAALGFEEQEPPWDEVQAGLLRVVDQLDGA